MKDLCRTFFLICILGSIGIACGGQNGTAEETREQYLTRVENQLLKMEDNILALRERAEQVLTEDKAEFESEIDSLAQEQKVIETKLVKLKEKDVGVEQLKAELEPMLAKLGKTYAHIRDW